MEVAPPPAPPVAFAKTNLLYVTVPAGTDNFVQLLRLYAGIVRIRKLEPSGDLEALWLEHADDPACVYCCYESALGSGVINVYEDMHENCFSLETVAGAGMRADNFGVASIRTTCDCVVEMVV